VAWNLLTSKENMKLTLLSSALASKDEHEGSEGLSIVTFWIPTSIALCVSLEGGYNGPPYSV